MCNKSMESMFKTGLNKAIEKHIPSKMIFNKNIKCIQKPKSKAKVMQQQSRTISNYLS